MAIDKTMAERVSEQQREQLFPSANLNRATVTFVPRDGKPLDGMRLALENLVLGGAFVRRERAQAAYDAVEEIITLAERTGDQLRYTEREKQVASRDAFMVSLGFILVGFMQAMGAMDEEVVEGDDAQRRA